MHQWLHTHAHLRDCVRAGQSFAKILAFDYDDGPTEGLAWSEHCLVSVKFDLLAWDERRELRIFSLAPLPPHSFAEVVAACSVMGSPRWPVWVPIWRFATEQQRLVAEQAVDNVLAGARPPELVVAARDLSRELLAVRAVADKEMAAIDDWFDFLGVAA
jgi:hypothetical protein